MIRLEDTGIIESNNVMSIANLSPSYSFEFESLSSVAKTIISSEHRRIPIVSKNQDLAGIITYMDILSAILRGLSRNTQISEFMTREVVFCNPTESIISVLQKIKISRRDGMPVVRNMKLIGMISEHDFIKLLFGKHFGIAVNEIMAHKPFFIPSNSSIQNCIKTMVNTNYRRLPVLNGKELVGIVTGHDVLKFLNDTHYNPSVWNGSVENIMSMPVSYTTEYDDISDALKLMKENNIGGLPVINEENHLKGIVTERDIVELI